MKYWDKRYHVRYIDLATIDQTRNGTTYKYLLIILPGLSTLTNLGIEVSYPSASISDQITEN